MTTTATQTRTRKPQPRTATIQTIGAVRVIWITNGKLTLAYSLESIVSELGGVAFQLSKANQGGTEEPEIYHVLLNGRDTSCTCPGHSYHGKCKHVDGLQALIQAGKIEMPAVQPQAAPAAVPAKSEPWCDRCNDNPEVFCSHCSL